MTTASKRDEVAFGVAQEARIAYDWLQLQEEDDLHIVKSGEYADFDYWVFQRDGILKCYLEVKMRRKPLSTFGDVMFPRRKRDFAGRAFLNASAPFLSVTEYACGALVEVNLAQSPSFERDIARRDRPGMTPVPHVFYKKDKMKVLRASVR